MPDKVRLGPLRDLWKTVADWVKGESEDVPKVQLTGTPKVEIEGTPKVQLTGTTVTIGGTEYRLLPDGNTLVGDSADEPDAAAAEAAIGDGVAYFAKDTRVLKTSDGTDWGPLL